MNSQSILKFDLKKWLWYLSVPGLIVILALGIFQAGEPAGFSAIVGTVLLAATLLPAACHRLGWWKQNPYLNYLLRYQRDLGITAGFWFLVHGASSALFFFDRNQPWLAQFTEKALQPTWIMVPVMIIMLITSIRSVQKQMGSTWKQVHGIVWVLPALMMMHGNLAIAAFEKEDFAPASILLLLFILIAVWDAVQNKSFKRVIWIAAGFILTWIIWWS